MLLTGTFPRTLDDKKRLALPKKWRDQMGDPGTLYLTPGPDQSLWLYSEVELERVARQLDIAPAADADARVFRRLFFAQAEMVELDRTGRLLVPDRLMQFAQLTTEVVLLGVRDHLELWDAARWHSYLNQHAAHFDKVAEQMFGAQS